MRFLLIFAGMYNEFSFVSLVWEGFVGLFLISCHLIASVVAGFLSFSSFSVL